MSLAGKHAVIRVGTNTETIYVNLHELNDWAEDKIRIITEIVEGVNDFLNSIAGDFTGVSLTGGPIPCITPAAPFRPELYLYRESLGRPLDFRTVNTDFVCEFLEPFFNVFDPYPYLTPEKLSVNVSCTSAYIVEVRTSLKRRSTGEDGGPDPKCPREIGESGT
jgi:hypothetical protein